MKFPCTGCGCCCKRVGHLKLQGMFPLDVNPDGSCVHLLPNNSCEIYETRPDICRVSVMAEKSGINESEYYTKTAEVCNNFMKEDGVEGKFVEFVPFGKIN